MPSKKSVTAGARAAAEGNPDSKSQVQQPVDLWSNVSVGPERLPVSNACAPCPEIQRHYRPHFVGGDQAQRG